jgi:hypothetical protein
MKMTERLAVNVLFGFGVNGLLSAVHRRPFLLYFSKSQVKYLTTDMTTTDPNGPRNMMTKEETIDDAIPPVCWVAVS